MSEVITKQDEFQDVSLNVLLVEDMYDDMVAAAEMVERCSPELKVYKVGCADKALEVLKDKEIDLLLLDIGLPDHNGFELTRMIREDPKYRFLHIVYITGEPHDPLDTYNNYHCYSFIKKPYKEDFFIGQIKPLIEMLKQEKTEGMRIARSKVRTFKVMGGERIVPLDDIVFIETSVRKIALHTTNGEVVVKGYTLEKILNYLDDPDFIRCHHGFIVNTRHMIGINRKSEKGTAVMLDTGDKGCLISQRNMAEVKKRLEEKAEVKRER